MDDNAQGCGCGIIILIVLFLFFREFLMKLLGFVIMVALGIGGLYLLFAYVLPWTFEEIGYLKERAKDRDYRNNSLEQDIQVVEKVYTDTLTNILLNKPLEIQKYLTDILMNKGSSDVRNDVVALSENAALELALGEFQLTIDDVDLFSPIVSRLKVVLGKIDGDVVSAMQFLDNVNGIYPFTPRLSAWDDENKAILKRVSRLAKIQESVKSQVNPLSYIELTTLLFSENEIYHCKIHVNVLSWSLSILTSEIINYKQISHLLVSERQLELKHNGGVIIVDLDNEDERNTARGLRSMLNAHLKER